MKRIRTPWFDAGISLLLAICFCLSGCAGLSRQFRATTGGIKIEYQAPRETLPAINSKIRVVVKDERVDSEFLGTGARSSFGSRALGLFAFGLVSLAVPGEPSFEQTDLVGIFQRAFEGRLRSNGVPVVQASAPDVVILEVLIRHFRLDFNFGKWIGEAGYVVSWRKDSSLLCEDRVSERVTKFNTFGFGTGETALSEVFEKAVNRANLSSCLSRLEQ